MNTLAIETPSLHLQVFEIDREQKVERELGWVHWVHWLIEELVRGLANG